MKLAFLSWFEHIQKCSKLDQIFNSKTFLWLSCAMVFLLSLFLRSTINIGPDTGIYLNIAHKINQGGRYYYDFFESNFPISFYFYALQERLAHLIHMSPIIMSEIVVNSLALLSIYCSSKILKRSTIYHNKAHYHLILLSFFVGFFLRPTALEYGEFGTKTSFLLIFLYPYLAYSFERMAIFTKKDLIYRGILMGLMPCIKPHYLVFIIVIEGAKMLQTKTIKHALQMLWDLDKMIMYFIGSFYVFLMVKFTPEFFEFMVPMWPVIYQSYSVGDFMMAKVFEHIAARIGIFFFIFLIFTRLKPSYNDKILILFYVAASLLILLEGLGTIDQIVIFHAITTTCFFKFLFDLLKSKKISMRDNLFIILSLMLLPIFDLERLPLAIFAVGSLIDAWWLVFLIYPFIFAKKYKKGFYSAKKIICFLFIYLSFIIAAIVILNHLGAWAYLAFNLCALLSVLFFFEKRVWLKNANHFSVFSTFMITASTSCLLYAYILPISHVMMPSEKLVREKALSESIFYYSKKFAPQKTDGILMVTALNQDKFSVFNYLNISDYQKFHIGSIKADHALFVSQDVDYLFTISYLFEDIKEQIKNPNVKLLFFNNSSQMLHAKDRCLIGVLEYYFRDEAFKRIFLEAFHFENRMTQLQEEKVIQPSINGKKKNDIYHDDDFTTVNISHIVGDFEVYVRNK